MKGIRFKGKGTIYFQGDVVYEDDNIVVKQEGTKLVHIDKKTGEQFDVPESRSEYIYHKIQALLKEINPKDTLARSHRSIPYVQVYIGKLRIPVIYYGWYILGLAETLSKLDIPFSSEPPEDKEFIKVELDSGPLYIIPNQYKHELVLNGFKVRKPEKGLKNDDITDFIIDNWGSTAPGMLDTITANIIDPITKELLEKDGHNTTLPLLLLHDMLDMLVNAPVSTLDDLSIYRLRLSEILFTLLYKQVQAARTQYYSKVRRGDEKAKLVIAPDRVIKELFTAGVLQYTEPVNPIDELMLATRIIKTGPGGLPDRRAAREEHRDIHPSQYGNISANSTPEYEKVGLLTHTTLNPMLLDKHGSFGLIDIRDATWQAVALDESLIPFVGSVETTRVNMAITHAKQVTPIEDTEPPIVSGGGDFIVPSLASNRFLVRAKKSGVVKEVTPHYIKVEYDDGTTEAYDIYPRRAKTKRGASIALTMKTLPPGTRFNAGDSLAWTNYFANGSRYASGVNLVMAVMNYMGYNYADGYVITEPVAERLKVKHIEVYTAIVPPDATLTTCLTAFDEPLHVKKGDVLLEYGYSRLENYFDMFSEDDVSVEATSIGDNKFRLISQVDGTLIGVKIYLNTRKVDPTVYKLYEQQMNFLRKLAKELTKGKKGREAIEAIDNLDLSVAKIGKHRQRGREFQGAKIEFHILVDKHVEIGDKLANRYGAKGVINYIIPKDQVPRSELFDHIDIFLSPTSVFKRKNAVILLELYLGKIFHVLRQRVQQMLDKSEPTKRIIQLILDVYKATAPDKKYVEKITEYFKSFKESELRNKLKNGQIQLVYITEPFKYITLDQVKAGADILEIPLDEKVYIPELGAWTADKVPVGIQYVQVLEHYSSVYATVRGRERYVSLTRQPTRGKAQEGGQSLGHLDLWALSTYDVGPVLKELLTARSDDHKAKRELLTQIYTKGKANLPESTSSETFKIAKDVLFVAMGLEFSEA